MDCKLKELLMLYFLINLYFTINWILLMLNILFMIFNYKYAIVDNIDISIRTHSRYKSLSLTYSLTYILSGLSLLYLAVTAIIKLRQRAEVSNITYNTVDININRNQLVLSARTIITIIMTPLISLLLGCRINNRIHSTMWNLWNISGLHVTTSKSRAYLYDHRGIPGLP